MRQVRRRSDLDGSLTVFAAVDGEPAGAFLLEDLIRPDAPRMARGLREAGIERVVLVTGDRADIAATVGRIVGTDTVLAECDPAEKVAAIRAADVVLTVDRVDALADAILIAQRSRRIALQAVLGMGLSLVAMVVASGGLLPPAAGAVLQEGIDVLAIGMALRAVLPGAVHSLAMEPADVALAQRLKAEHDATLGVVEQIRAVADTLSTQESVLAPVHALMVRLANELLPHERADEELMVPLVARALGTSATTSLTRTHAEIEHQVGRLRRLLGQLDTDSVQPEDVVELRRLLYGLYGVLRLHNAQEEEGAFSLVPAGRLNETNGAG
jgi:iron-sulfur cluster repair protein YtfE (RIC family)